jgi:hypothetical protein
MKHSEDKTDLIPSRESILLPPRPGLVSRLVFLVIGNAPSIRGIIITILECDDEKSAL